MTVTITEGGQSIQIWKVLPGAADKLVADVLAQLADDDDHDEVLIEVTSDEEGNPWTSR